ncbi:hypothetical protein RRG08_000252 [Elysia crispata]|uniref:C-type lectin domain-containing protein n=1 Tax=Elysia crispata TaxID=231223 RepID=A0AAE1CU35_9GAST|nr:hypothetical protein RRG08_000252 [Elysia crispata]
MTWTNARIQCQSHGADLLINYTKEKEDVIYETKNSYIGERFWIGLNDRAEEGNFYYLTAKAKITDVHWGKRYAGVKENPDCVDITKNYQLQVEFNTVTCLTKNFFICEFHLACKDNTFGAYCSETCSKNCAGPNNACHNVNGSCMFGCVDGYHGERCQDQCNAKTFGAKCSEPCSKNCAGPNNACYSGNGSCMFGCVDGFHGEKCQDSKVLKKEFSYPKEAIVAATTLGTVIAICVALSIAVRYIRNATASVSEPMQDDSHSVSVMRHSNIPASSV